MDNSFQELFHKIVDAFEPGQPTALIWIVLHQTHELYRDYKFESKALLDRVTPKTSQYSKIFYFPEGGMDDPLIPRGYVGFFRLGGHYLSGFSDWTKTFPGHHDLFVRY